MMPWMCPQLSSTCTLSPSSSITDMSNSNSRAILEHCFGNWCAFSALVVVHWVKLLRTRTIEIFVQNRLSGNPCLSLKCCPSRPKSTSCSTKIAAQSCGPSRNNALAHANWRQRLRTTFEASAYATIRQCFPQR